MFKVSDKITELEKQCKQDIIPLQKKINEIQNHYNNMISKLYDSDLRTFFDFEITNSMSEDYNTLLDNYIDMMEVNYDAINIDMMEALINHFNHKYRNK